MGDILRMNHDEMMRSLQAEWFVQREVVLGVFDLFHKSKKLCFSGTSNPVEVFLELSLPFLHERRILISEYFLLREPHTSQLLVQHLKEGISGLETIFVDHGPSENFVFLKQNNVVLDVLPDVIGLYAETELGGNAFGFFLVGVFIVGVDGAEIFL